MSWNYRIPSPFSIFVTQFNKLLCSPTHICQFFHFEVANLEKNEIVLSNRISTSIFILIAIDAIRGTKLRTCQCPQVSTHFAARIILENPTTTAAARAHSKTLLPSIVRNCNCHLNYPTKHQQDHQVAFCFDFNILDTL